MAEAVVTLKLTTEEFRTLSYALDLARRETVELTEKASPTDLQGMRAMVLKLDDLKAKL